MVEVCHNYDGPIHSVDFIDNKKVYTDISLQRGKKMIYEGGTLYANIYANQIHQVDCMSQQVKVTEIEPHLRVLTAMRFAKYDYTFTEAIYRAGFLLYDLNAKQLVVLAASEDSRELKYEIRINHGLDNVLGLTRDIYACNLLAFNVVKYLIFQRKNKITYYAFRNETTVTTREVLPFEMHINKFKLHYVQKDSKGAFNIISSDFFL